MKEHQKLAAEGSGALPFILAMAGILVCAIILVESYFQMTNSPSSFIRMLNQAGLTSYKPAREPNHGIWHLTGWIGSGCFAVMMIYSVRKRFRFMVDVGPIRYWLDGHMFLGILGTVFVTVHSTYKFGGIVSLSYWSAVLVALSGFVGRYLYVQIPHSISGNELRMDDIDAIMRDIDSEIEIFSEQHVPTERYFERRAPVRSEDSGLLSAVAAMIATDISDIRKLATVWFALRADGSVPKRLRSRLFTLIRERVQLERSIRFLSVSHRLLHHWHVFHKPFAVIMFIIMFLHIGVFYLFRV